MEYANENLNPGSRLWLNYKRLITARIIGNRVYDTKDISYWRDRLFADIIIYFLPFCSIALIPGVAMSYISGHWFIGAIDLLAFAMILAISLAKGLSLKFRKISFVAIIYCLSVALIALLSLFGPGMLYLIAVCVLVTFILPQKWGYLIACTNLLVCLCCGLLTHFHFHFFDSPMEVYGWGAWLTVCSNLVFLSFILVAVANRAIEGLERSLMNDALLKAENLSVIRHVEHSEQRLKQAQALAHVGSWELEFSTGIAVWSEEACRIYGLPPEDNVQSYDNWIAFHHPEDLAEVIRITTEASKRFSNSSFFHRIVRQDGGVRHLYSESRYDFDGQGQATGMYGIAHDITELRESQEKLRMSNERFELVNRAAREAILDWDITRDITFWGNGFTEIFGYSPSGYHNHLLSDNIHPDDRTDALNNLKNVLEDPAASILHREFRFLKADRSIAHVQIRTIFIRDNFGKAIRAVSSLLDVTNLVNKTKALEKQNTALKEIAWIQSHEIRSPLACIMGLTEMLQEKQGQSLGEKRLINELQSAALRLDHVIREVVRRTED